MAEPRPARKVGPVRPAPDLIDRLQALTVRVERAQRRSGELADLEDVLTTGYAGALSGEARMIRLERQLDDLLDTAAEDRARELRLIVREHRVLERAVAELRSALARLQADVVALGAAAPR